MKFYFAGICIFTCSLITVTSELKCLKCQEEIEIPEDKKPAYMYDAEQSWSCADIIRNVIPYFSSLVKKSTSELEGNIHYKDDLKFQAQHRKFHDRNSISSGRNQIQHYLLKEGYTVVKEEHGLTIKPTTPFDETDSKNKTTVPLKQFTKRAPRVDKLSLFEIYVWFIKTIDSIDFDDLYNPGLKTWKLVVEKFKKENISTLQLAYLINHATALANAMHHDYSSFKKMKVRFDTPDILNTLVKCLKNIAHEIPSTARTIKIWFDDNQYFTLVSSITRITTPSRKWNLMQLAEGLLYEGGNRPADIPSKKSVEARVRKYALNEEDAEKDSEIDK